ncbi:MAG: response regulator [Treponema sp.]|nr:response regulator [Treponema sp.]MCL2251472.1 response regulator [Treponema sp.]
MEKSNSLLIVDDDVSNLIELTHILQTEYKIHTSKDGKTAIEMAKKSMPDLILLDIIMPNMNGFEVLAEIKKNELIKDIPVIFITGISEGENESAGLSIGAVDYIRKPFDSMVVKLRVRHQIQIINLKRKLVYAAHSAEAASQAKSVFLANMSHEIRTPMNAILGVTEILIQYKTLPAEIEEGLNKIYSSCDLLLGIINDILDFSKVEAGKLDIIPNQYKVASMINDSIQLNMMRINLKPIEFELQIDENLPAELLGDDLRIKQILNNLLSNAFKYTDSGKIILTVGFEPQPSRKGEGSPLETLSDDKNIILILSVSDTGCGLTQDQMNKMFEEYSRFNNEKKAGIEGTGLGLAITQRLVNLMSGCLQADSEPNKGSVFTVRLPQQKVNDEILGKDVTENLKQFRVNYMMRRKREHIARDPMPYGSVLIIDDVETNIYVAVGLLKLYKLQIETAMSGKEAIDLIKSGKVYDIIFMDHMMPEMDGIEAVRQIRDFGYKSPIVALTANAVIGQTDLFLKNGFDEFISKPIDIRQLNYVLIKFVRDKQTLEVIEAARKQNVNKVFDTPHIDSMLLESFIRDANKALIWLGECCSTDAQKNGFKDEKELQKFTIAVHGMKSSLWNINENGLAELADKLEMDGKEIAKNFNKEASKEKSLELINKSAPDFIDKLHKLLDKLEIKRLEYEKNLLYAEDDTEDLCRKLKEIQKRAAEYDRKGVLDVIAEIKKYSKETKETLDKIVEFILHSEFEEAEKIAASREAELSL